MKKTLTEIHEDVPADHYDKGYHHNILQKYWHSRRIIEIKRMLPTQLGKILDVGCHAGFITENILRAVEYQTLDGIDISKQAIKHAKKRIKQGNFVVGDAHKLPYKQNQFDSLFCFEALEHLENPPIVIKEMKRVLKKNGAIYILVPTDNLLFRSNWKLWNQVYPIWKHAHVQSFQSDRLVELLIANGFTIEKVKRFHSNMLLLVKARKIS